MAEGPDRWLDVIALTDLKPLEGGVGPDAENIVPEALEGILFPQTKGTEETGAFQTFAIVDAATCSILPELLEGSGLQHRCLFTGQAEQEYRDAAPWLVQLEPGNRFTKQLLSMSDTPGGLWDLEPGLLLTSRMSFDQLWSHCRKFTRLQDDEGRWLYYRYWAPTVSTRVMALGNRPELIQLVSPLFPSTPNEIDVILFNSDMSAVLRRVPGTTPPAQRPVLTKAAQETIRQVRRVQQYEEIIDITVKHVDRMTSLSPEDIRAALRLKRDRFFGFGFWRRDHLAKLCVWEVLLGPDFVENYSGGQVRDIILAAPDDWRAIESIGQLLEPPPPEEEEEQINPPS